MNKHTAHFGCYLVAAACLAGCATVEPVPHQTLFHGTYSHVAEAENDNGCNAEHFADCDRSTFLVAFSEGERFGGLRLVLGPQGNWSDQDITAHLKASVTRAGGKPVVRIERIYVDDNCGAAVELSVEKSSTLTLPACSVYPALHATWKKVTPFQKAMEHTTDGLVLLFTALTGGELP